MLSFLADAGGCRSGCRSLQAGFPLGTSSPREWEDQAPGHRERGMYSTGGQVEPRFLRKGGRSSEALGLGVTMPGVLLLAVHFLVLGHDAPVCSATGCCTLAVQGGHRLSSANSQCLKVGFLPPSPMAPCKACSQKRAPGSTRYSSHLSTPLCSDALIHTAFLLGR